MHRLVMIAALAGGCGGGSSGPDATPTLGIVATLNEGDLEACRHIWNVGFEVTLYPGPIVLLPEDAVGQDNHLAEWFRIEFAWPPGVDQSQDGLAVFTGNGEGQTSAEGSTTFIPTPDEFELVNITASCRFELPDAGP